MPVYEWECSECGLRKEMNLRINEYDEVARNLGKTHSDTCSGHFERVFSGSVSHSWKGGPPTPKFGR
jgi:predicted nucleic acid-binding Zn ribbon protein